MAKLQCRCLHCGKVGDAKYQWGTTNPGDDNEYFCSEECALKCFSGVLATKCGRCGKTLCDGNIFYRYSHSDKVYCSAKCFLAERRIVMRWIKFSKQMPEVGTICLCRSDHAETMSDYTVAEFRGYSNCGGKYHEWCDSDFFCWLGEDYCYHTEAIAEYWVPLFELDKELRHEVE